MRFYVFMYVYLQERVVKIVDRLVKLGNIRSVLSVCVCVYFVSVCGVFIVVLLGLNPRLKHFKVLHKKEKICVCTVRRNNFIG